MSLRIARLAAGIEQDNSFHLARLLLLITQCASGSAKTIPGLTKLAKLDFFLRYPSSLMRLLEAQNLMPAEFPARHFELNSIESRMIRYRYGPWDKRYRRWLSILVGKGLIELYQEGRTIHIRATPKGSTLAAEIRRQRPYSQLSARCELLASATKRMSATRIKDTVYELFPEISSLSLGSDIAI